VVKSSVCRSRRSCGSNRHDRPPRACWSGPFRASLRADASALATANRTQGHGLARDVSAGSRAAPRENGQDTRPIRRAARSLLTSGRCQRAPLAQLAEQRTLNPRVRGSSPWRRTRSDLGFYHPRSFFCVRFVPMAAPWLLARTDPAIWGLSKTGRAAPRGGAFAPEPGRLARPAPPRAR
jgi:hypothetical protein